MSKLRNLFVYFFDMVSDWAMSNVVFTLYVWLQFLMYWNNIVIWITDNKYFIYKLIEQICGKNTSNT